MNGYIYKITNTINGMVYVGQTVSQVRSRFASHKRNAKNLSNNFKITLAIAKYKPENFTVETLAQVPREWLNAAEVSFIAACKSNDLLFGYNINAGGSGYAEWTSEKISKAMAGRIPWNKGKQGPPAWNKGLPWDETTKAKMAGPRGPITQQRREANAARNMSPDKVLARETKAANRLAERLAKKAVKSEAAVIARQKRLEEKPVLEPRQFLPGAIPWNKGVPASEEHKLKLSESHKGIIPSAESNAKRAASLRGQKRTEAQRKTMSESAIGRKNSDEHKQSCRDAIKALWADPVYRENMLQSRRDKAALRKAA